MLNPGVGLKPAIGTGDLDPCSLNRPEHALIAVALALWRGAAVGRRCGRRRIARRPSRRRIARSRIAGLAFGGAAYLDHVQIVLSFVRPRTAATRAGVIADQELNSALMPAPVRPGERPREHQQQCVLDKVLLAGRVVAIHWIGAGIQVRPLPLVRQRVDRQKAAAQRIVIACTKIVQLALRVVLLALIQVEIGRRYSARDQIAPGVVVVRVGYRARPVHQQAHVAVGVVTVVTRRATNYGLADAVRTVNVGLLHRAGGDFFDHLRQPGGTVVVHQVSRRALGHAVAVAVVLHRHRTRVEARQPVQRIVLKGPGG